MNYTIQPLIWYFKDRQTSSLSSPQQFGIVENRIFICPSIHSKREFESQTLRCPKCCLHRCDLVIAISEIRCWLVTVNDSSPTSKTCHRYILSCIPVFFIMDHNFFDQNSDTIQGFSPMCLPLYMFELKWTYLYINICSELQWLNKLVERHRK